MIFLNTGGEIAEGAVTNIFFVKEGGILDVYKRQHQIRVHMAYLGHPLAGDDLYGGHKDIMLRQALHCQKIIFFTKNSQTAVLAQMPPDLGKCIKRLKKEY